MQYIPEEKIRKICQEVNGTYGLFISLPERGEKLVIDADTRYHAASTIKIPLLALLLKDFADGRLDPDKPEPIWECNRVGGSGVLNSLSDHYLLTLYDYAVLMIIVSDNSATNQIIDKTNLRHILRLQVREFFGKLISIHIAVARNEKLGVILLYDLEVS